MHQAFSVEVREFYSATAATVEAEAVAAGTEAAAAAAAKRVSPTGRNRHTRHGLILSMRPPQTVAAVSAAASSAAASHLQVLDARGCGIEEDDACKIGTHLPILPGQLGMEAGVSSTRCYLAATLCAIRTSKPDVHYQPASGELVPNWKKEIVEP